MTLFPVLSHSRCHRFTYPLWAAALSLCWSIFIGPVWGQGTTFSTAFPVATGHDVVNTIALAQPGAGASISNPFDVDMYRFNAYAGQRFSFNINFATTLDSYIRLFDSQGHELAKNDNAHGPGPQETSLVNSYLQYSFDLAGVYYLSVSASSNNLFDPITGTGTVNGGSSGSYQLVISPGLEGGINVNNNPVDLIRLPYSRPSGIRSTGITWVVIHGWNSSRNAQNISDLAQTLASVRPDDQVLTLDWSSAADSGLFDPFDAAASIIPAAQWAAAALTLQGISGTNLNLVGHSFGAYVADEIAKRIPGGVNSIVALDPAANVAPNQFNPVANSEIDFSRDSQFSWAFHASSAGNEYTPVSADEAFIADTGVDTLTAHSNVVELLAWIWAHPNDPFGRLFTIQRLLDDNYGPWKLDEYSSFFFLDDTVPGYEAIIDEGHLAATPTDTSAQFSIEYSSQTKVPELFLQRDGTNIIFGLKDGGWGAVRVQWSTDLKHWTNGTDVFSLSYNGTTTTLSIPENAPSAAFYRLISAN